MQLEYWWVEIKFCAGTTTMDQQGRLWDLMDWETQMWCQTIHCLPFKQVSGFGWQQKPKPSCHNVMVGKYVPTQADIAANRTAGYGFVTNIINGGLECGIPDDSRVNDRIGYFQRYATMFNVDTGPNLDCANQKSF